MKAAQFDNELDSLRQAIASLKGCRDYEVANESRILVNQINACKAMKLARRNESRELRRDELIGYAITVLTERRRIA